MSPAADNLTVALVGEVFTGERAASQLDVTLARARELGATLALLPELPLDPWHPASDQASEAHAEGPDGPRQTLLSAAAARAGMGLVGGAILVDPATSRRHNTALVYDARGELVARYRKVHVPWEEGFWERAHYDAGDTPPTPVDGFGLRLGLQLCSDLMRPQGCHLLGAAGAEAVLAPRATLDWTWERWRRVMRASAVTSAVYLCSANRPGPERGVSMGGPSVVVDPHGEILLETSEPLAVATLQGSLVAEAREAYPGYLDVSAELYARGWERTRERSP